MRTRVKMCGITRVEDAVYAAALGVDAIGLVFYAGSPRCISAQRAAKIIRSVPAFVTTVGLFVNAAVPEIEQVLELAPVDVLQFHGEEDRDQCERWRKPYIKAIRMQDHVDVDAACRTYRTAGALLLDTHVTGVAGGTGRTFDWSRVPSGSGCPIILAGGLTPDNVADAIARVHPYAVDVSGGIEAEKGIKDHAKMEAFVRSVNSVVPD
jgi:phosphoribosylanthranilate isomerase